MRTIQFLLSLILSIFATSSLAGDWWTVNVTPLGLYGDYSGTTIRENTNAFGGIVDFQYLERFGFAVGDTHRNIKYKYNIPTLRQDTTYFSVRDYLYLDALPGALTLRLDTYKIFGNDPTNETTDVIVGNPIVSFLNYKQSFYLDFGYAYSKYGTNNFTYSNLNISQITSTVGFGFNELKNWLSVRFYGTNSSNPIRSANVSQTFGTEITLIHYLAPNYLFVPHKIQLGTFVGQRMYAVDSNTMIVYNLADLQKNSIYLQAQWRLKPNVTFLLNGGNLRFENVFNNQKFNYGLNYIYASLTFRF